MKKLAFLALILPLLISWPTGLVQAATQEEILKNPEKYPELEEYKQIFFANLRDQNLDWPEKAQKIIDGYKEFIKKYSGNEFADEAKLRIAEMHELSFQKEKALPYLTDIIKNHPQADYFSLTASSSPKIKTAAWALYYRGLWFMHPEAVSDWERILAEYPESKEVVGLAKAALAKFKSKFKKQNE